MSDDIKIEYSINKEELRCTICMIYLSEKIFRCINGPHYVCEDCNTTLTSCPTCRHENKPFRAIDLEQSLVRFKTKCKYCPKNIFTWDKEHEEECPFAPVNCEFCKRVITGDINDIINHYSHFCDKEFFVLKVQTLKDTYKVNFSQKSSLVIVNGGIYCLFSFFERDHYKFRAFSKNDKYLGKPCKIIVNSPMFGNGLFNIFITNLSDSKKDLMIPIQHGSSFLLQGPNFKPPEKEHVLNRQMISEMLRLFDRI